MSVRVCACVCVCVCVCSKFTDSQRAQVFQLFYDMLSYQRTSGGVLSGVMFWNGAIGGQIWDDGFNAGLYRFCMHAHIQKRLKTRTHAWLKGRCRTILNPMPQQDCFTSNLT